MTKYLVIGSKGTLGSEFVQQLQSSSENELHVADRPEIDITDFTATKIYITEIGPTVVINCAAYTDVDGAESNYETALQLNGEAVKYLAEICNEINATLIHFSTGMIFPGLNPAGYNETDLPKPVNKYGESKLAGEQYLQEICQKYFIIRTEWLYGKPLTETAKKSFIELMIELGKSGTVKAVIDEIGKPTWARDLVTATVGFISSNQEYGIYHLTNEGQASRLGWTQEIYNQLKMDVNIESVSGAIFPRPAPRPHFELLNNNKMPKMRPWQEALKEYLANETN